MGEHIELTITAPDKGVLANVVEYCAREVGEPDVDEVNLRVFIAVHSHGDCICIKNHSEELGCSVHVDYGDVDD